jgi:hypothetical protein
MRLTSTKLSNCEFVFFYRYKTICMNMCASRLMLKVKYHRAKDRGFCGLDAHDLWMFWSVLVLKNNIFKLKYYGIFGSIMKNYLFTTQTRPIKY